MLLFVCWLSCLAGSALSDDVHTAQHEHFAASGPFGTDGNLRQQTEVFFATSTVGAENSSGKLMIQAETTAASLLQEPFSFRSSLSGAPDFLPLDVPFIERAFISETESDRDDIKRPSGIQLISADSNVTFLRARKSGSTTVAAATGTAALQPVPPENSVPKPSDTPKAGNVGNVMVIPAQAVPSPTAVVQPPATEAPPAEAQTNDVAPATITLEMITAQRLAAEVLPDLKDEVKVQLTKHFQRASESIAQKTDIDKRIGELKAEKENGPTLIAEHRALLTQPPPKSEPEYPLGATVAELDQLRLADEEKAAESRQNMEAWEAKSKTRAEKKPQMPALIETTRKQLEDAEKAASSAAPDGELPVLGAARRLDQEAYILMLRSQLELYRIEQTHYEALNELFPLQHDVLTRAKNSIDKRIELWKTVLADAGRDESARQAQEAREKLRNAHPTLRDLAEDNSRLTLRRKELQEFLQTKVKELSNANATLSGVEQKFKNVTEKEKRAGLTTAIGLLLRSQRSHLPAARGYRRQQQTAEQDIVRLPTEQMPLEDERSDLGDIEAQVEASLGLTSADAAANGQLREMTVELLSDRRHYLDDLLADYDSCLQTLAETDVTCRRLETTIREYESYIDERVLWIRSATAIDSGFIQKTWESVQSFATHRQWRPLARFMVQDAQVYRPLYGLILMAFGLIIGLSRRMRRFVAELGDTAQQQLDSGIPLTLLATILTVVMATAWPMLLWFVGSRLSYADMNLASALSLAFLFCAAALWLVDSFRKLCRKRGVAESFLAWPKSIVRSLHANLLLYVAGGIPLSFIVGTASRLDDGTSTDSVGRLAFVSFCLLLAVMLRRIVRPSGAIIGDLLRSSPNSMMYRLRWLWYPPAVGSPLCLAVLALMGYQYTAEQLMIRLQLTLVLSIVLLITYTMLMQWMLAAKLRLATKQARARRVAALAAAQRKTDDDGSEFSPIPVTEPPQVDLSLLNQQILRLVRGTACILFFTIGWGIWGQVLPALQVFSRIELWSVVVETTQQAVTGVDGAAVQEITRIEPVTLGHLLFSALVFSVAVLASRNLPGLLELAVLQRLPMDHGGRNAITTLCRYAFMLAGCIVACNTIGIRWGSVQWLVAALTVGLGFGLQEIFANFVSGLIILFERPIRIGDVVTIDGVTGCVSRIQIRATTITDWDRKEYIVPNKEFVTGKLLNWTLSDKTNRIVVKIGVAYGTDTENALAMLQQIADEHPLILKDPPPVVGFEGFGESSLHLVLRCFLPSLDNRLKVITQLHVMIDRRFKEARFEIAFPQRDVHVRSMPPQFGLAGTVTPPSADATMETPTQNIHPIKRSA
ncbi:MAG: mechanosensitive ion channel domain-containing protein [Planctomycetaceae bacterium]